TDSAYVPEAALCDALSVSAEPPVVCCGFQDAVKPAGRPWTASVTASANPFRGEMVTGTVALPPRVTVLVDLTRTSKSGAGSTVTAAVAEWVSPPPATRTEKTQGPAAAPRANDRV